MSRAERRAAWAAANPERAALEAERRSQRQRDKEARAQATAEVVEKHRQDELKFQQAVEPANAIVRSLAEPAAPITLDEIATKLRDAYALAMSLAKPEVGVTAALALAKVAGLVVDKSAVAVGSPEQFRNDAEEQAQIYNNIERKFGPGGRARFEAFVQEMRRIGDGRTIEHEADACPAPTSSTSPS